VTLLLNREVVSIEKLCLVSVFPRIVKDCPKKFRECGPRFLLNQYSRIINHRLRGSASLVLTATLHSYRSPKLSDFFPAHPWRSHPSTDFDPKWLKRRAFTQGCALCSKKRYILYPLISRSPKRSKFCKFLDL